MDNLSEQLRVEFKKSSWNRNPDIFIEAAIELEKLQDEINTNVIIHVREMNKLLKKGRLEYLRGYSDGVVDIDKAIKQSN